MRIFIKIYNVKIKGMRKFRLFIVTCVLAVASLGLVSCELTVQDVEKTTKEIIVEEYEKEGSTMEIDDLTLTQSETKKKTYTGTATGTLDGEKVRLSITSNVVSHDSGDIVVAKWEVEPVE